MQLPAWLVRLSQRSQVSRVWIGDLSAIYWEGSPDSDHPVREITLNGAYIETATTWPSGTMILISLRYRPFTANPERSFANFWVEVTRSEPNGLWVSFVFSSASERRQFRRFLRALERLDLGAPQPTRTPASETRGKDIEGTRAAS